MIVIRYCNDGHSFYSLTSIFVTICIQHGSLGTIVNNIRVQRLKYHDTHVKDIGAKVKSYAYHFFSLKGVRKLMKL